MSGTTMIYVKNESRIRLRALAHLEGRTLIEYLDRLARYQVSKIDPLRYNGAVEHVTRGPDDIK